MDQLDATPIRGTEGATSPFFSPDGQWIGFFSADGKLAKVPLTGGASLAICDAIVGFGATWLRDDSIVFSSSSGGALWRVSAAGGKPPQELLRSDVKSEIAIHWPHVLPDGKTIIFEILRSTDSAIGAFRLDTHERLVLIEAGGSNPQYLPSEHIVFARGNGLVAIPFDLRKLQVKGRLVPVLEGIFSFGPGSLGGAAFTASAGSIAYIRAAQAPNGLTLVWVDRHGTAQPLSAPKRNYQFPRLSPDGQRIALRIQDASADIWLYQIARGTLSRFTSNGNDAETAMWTPDGKRIAYAVTGNPARQIILKSADCGAGEEVLAGSERHLHLGGWSPKGDALIAMATDAGNIWELSTTGDKRALQLFLQTPYQLRAGTISPNGRWLAYASNETGRFEVYVQAFPSPGAKYPISTSGGAEPIWAKNGRELFFRNGDKMMAVTIAEKDDKLQAGDPTLLFEGRFAVSSVSGGDAWYDISPDGSRFLMLKNDDAPNSTANIVVAQDWIGELKRLAPPK